MRVPGSTGLGSGGGAEAAFERFPRALSNLGGGWREAERAGVGRGLEEERVESESSAELLASVITRDPVCSSSGTMIGMTGVRRVGRQRRE